MTRAHLGLLLLDVLYVGLGAAVLRATGVTVAGRIRRVGLWLALGWATFAVAASIALVAGLAVTAWQIVVLCAAVGAGALLVRREPEATTGPTLPERAWQRYLGVGAAVVLSSYLALVVLRALLASADRNYDSWAFWLPKAQAIYFFGLDTGPGGFTTFDNPEYPPAGPALHAAGFHFAGGVEIWALPLQSAIVGVAFVVAAAALLGRRVPGWILWPSLLAAVVAPNVDFYFDSVLADLPVAYLVSLGAVAGSLWLLDGSNRLLALAAIFLAAASLTKTEGFMLSLVLVAALTGASLLAPRRRRPLLALAAAPILSFLIWKAWLAATGQRLESVLYSSSDLLRPSYLADRLDRLGYASGELVGLVFDPQRWLLIGPLALVAGALALVRRPALGVFYLGWLAVSFAGLTSVYWISNADVVWHVDTSAARVVASLMIFAGVLLPLLLAELGREPRRS